MFNLLLDWFFFAFAVTGGCTCGYNLSKSLYKLLFEWVFELLEPKSYREKRKRRVKKTT